MGRQHHPTSPAVGFSSNADPRIMLSAGTPAPDFSLPADDGRTVRLSDYRGRHVVLFFYPKDDTPG